MTELLPCPFCGSKEAILCKTGGADRPFHILCECGGRVGWFFTKEEAIRTWNTRTPKERGEENDQ